MNSHEFTEGTLSLEEMEAAIEQARIARAKALREMLIALPALVKRLAAHLHLHHQRLPQAKACA